MIDFLVGAPFIIALWAGVGAFVYCIYQIIFGAKEF